MEWYLKKASGDIYGPVTNAELRQWAAGGRIAFDDQISTDQETWMPAVDLPDLGLDWMVELGPEKTLYGPFHLLALGDLIREGSVPAAAPVVHRVTGERHVLHEALLLVVLEQNTRLSISAQELRLQLEAAQAELDSIKSAPLPEPAAAPAAEAAPEELPPASPAVAPPAGPAEAAPAMPAAVAPPPPPADRNAEWKDMAGKRDHFEKETHRWKRLYADLQASSTKREQEMADRVEHLRREEAAARTQLEQTQSSLQKVQKTVKQISEATVFATDAEASAAQRAAVLEAYNELSSRCDTLMEQLNAKSIELDDLMQSQQRIKAEADTRVQAVEVNLRKEREEADRVRKRALMLESDHLQLLRSFRDLNDRYIRMRQGAGHVSTAENPWPPPSEVAVKKDPSEF